MAKQQINTENTRIGNEFENLIVEDLKMRGALTVDKEKRSLEKLQILKLIGIEIDIIAFFDDYKEYIEGKGGYTNKSGAGKGVGASRTDNVKKAIANGALFKCLFPEDRFVAYFSAKPIKGSSSDIMISIALTFGIFSEVRYLTQIEKDYDSLVNEDGRFI